MDPISSKYSVWKRILHKFQARRDIPFRKKFFMGYDLHGNTYWEFTLDGNMHRLRRKMEPFREFIFKADYFSTVPPPWLQWLRRTRAHPPTVQELVEEQIRQANIRVLAQQADEKWINEKLALENEQRLKLENELARVEREKGDSVNKGVGDVGRVGTVKETVLAGDQSMMDTNTNTGTATDTDTATNTDTSTNTHSTSMSQNNHTDSSNKNHPQGTTDSPPDDPWAEANKAQEEDFNPIESANIPIRK